MESSEDEEIIENEDDFGECTDESSINKNQKNNSKNTQKNVLALNNKNKKTIEKK